MGEKRDTMTTVTPVMDEEKQQQHQQEQHHTVEEEKRASFLQRFPFVGASSNWGAALLLIVSAILLRISDHSPVDRWVPFQPSTYLSIVTSLQNVLVHVALSEGIVVAWWYAASRPDTKVSDLHEQFLHGVSTTEALLSFRHPSVISFAVIFVSLIAINGPVLQRSITSGKLETTSNVTTTIPIATDLNNLWETAIYASSDTPSILTPGFTVTAGNWLYGSPQSFQGYGCAGNSTCKTTVLGNGFAIKCSNETVPYTIPVITGHTQNSSLSAQYDSLVIFNVSSTWSHIQPGVINISTIYKPTTGCTGELFRNTCQLSAAIVEYPVIIDNTIGNATITTDRDVDPLSQVVHQDLTQGSTAEDTTYKSTYGGHFLIIRDKFTTSTEIRSWTSQNTQLVLINGTLSNYYAYYDQQMAQNGSSACALKFNSDPMPDMLRDIRQLGLMAASDAGAGVQGSAAYGTASNSSTWLASTQTTAEQTTTDNVFFAHWAWWGGSVAIVAIATLAVAPTFQGWWVLRQRTTLSPIETARAFNAPGLAREEPAYHHDHHHDYDHDQSAIPTTTAAVPPTSAAVAADIQPAATLSPQETSAAAAAVATRRRSAIPGSPTVEEMPDMLQRVGAKKARESMILDSHLTGLNSPTRFGGLQQFFPVPRDSARSGAKSPAPGAESGRRSVAGPTPTPTPKSPTVPVSPGLAVPRKIDEE